MTEFAKNLKHIEADAERRRKADAIARLIIAYWTLRRTTPSGLTDYLIMAG